VFPAGRQRMLFAQTGTTGQATGSSTMAVSKSPSSGMSYLVHAA
jgi:hypothetical protein